MYGVGDNLAKVRLILDAVGYNTENVRCFLEKAGAILEKAGVLLKIARRCC